MSTYGSLQNMMMGNAKVIEPEVGMGATALSYTDRRAATIVEVQRFTSGAKKGQVKAIVIQFDKATRTDSLGMSDAQSYEFERDTDAPMRTYTLRKNGRFIEVGCKFSSVLIGHRDHYYDYSF